MKNNPEIHDDLDLIHDDEIRIVGSSTSESFTADESVSHCKRSSVHFLCTLPEKSQDLMPSTAAAKEAAGEHL